jgi:hypothetical protein
MNKEYRMMKERTMISRIYKEDWGVEVRTIPYQLFNLLTFQLFNSLQRPKAVIIGQIGQKRPKRTWWF